MLEFQVSVLGEGPGEGTISVPLGNLHVSVWMKKMEHIKFGLFLPCRCSVLSWHLAESSLGEKNGNLLFFCLCCLESAPLLHTALIAQFHAFMESLFDTRCWLQVLHLQRERICALFPVLFYLENNSSSLLAGGLSPQKPSPVLPQLSWTPSRLRTGSKPTIHSTWRAQVAHMSMFP